MLWNGVNNKKKSLELDLLMKFTILLFIMENDNLNIKTSLVLKFNK